MAVSALPPFVTAMLAFSLLTSTRAIYMHPNDVSATPSPQDGTLKMVDEVKNQKETMEDQLFSRRLDHEINRDYPGWGANNHHTPNPPTKD